MKRRHDDFASDYFDEKTVQALLPATGAATALALIFLSFLFVI